MIQDLTFLASQFAYEGVFEKGEPFGMGHINDTFVIYVTGAPYRRFILQRINQYVFKNPEEVMENVLNITSFLREKIRKSGGDPNRGALTLIPAKDGKPYYRQSPTDYWRCYLFLEGAKAYQLPQTPDQFYQAGKAFGQFLGYLQDYPAHTLHDTIPFFHHTQQRFANLLTAIRQDKAGRANTVGEEIAFALSLEADAGLLVHLLAEGKLPLRVTHNDTKLNNVMLDEQTGEAMCVIDLDTVMPGLSLYDFGDAIRAGAVTAPEDEENLSLVSLDLGLFEAYTKGYLEEARRFLTGPEMDLLVFSAKLITYEQGIRFLTDYLDGDIYYKIHRPLHNLDRARNQFHLVRDIVNKKEAMEAIVEKYRKRLSR